MEGRESHQMAIPGGVTEVVPVKKRRMAIGLRSRERATRLQHQQPRHPQRGIRLRSLPRLVELNA